MTRFYMYGKRVKPRLQRVYRGTGLVLLVVFLVSILLVAFAITNWYEEVCDFAVILLVFGFVGGLQFGGRVLLKTLFVGIGWMTREEAEGFVQMMNRPPDSWWEPVSTETPTEAKSTCVTDKRNEN